MPQSGKGVHLWRVRANATFSDHLRLVPRQDPYPNDRQFQAFLGNEVGRGQRMVLMVDPGTRGENLGTERGPGTGWPYPTVPLMSSPSGPVASPLPPPPARYAASASPVGEATRPAWAGPGCLKPWAGAGWIGFPEAIYIYIYKGCREPWGQPLPKGATLWGPASYVLHSCPEAGSPFIALGRLAKGAEEGGLERVEEESRKPSLLTCCQSFSSL